MLKNLNLKTVSLVSFLILAGAILSSCCAICPMHRKAAAPCGGCPLPRGAFVESLDNFQKYFKGGAWDVAYKALREVNANTPDTTDPILLQGDDIRLMVSTPKIVAPQEAVVESHKDFIDIQMVIQGADRFRWWAVPGLKARTEYDAAKDIIFYATPAAPQGELLARPGTFAVFMPCDAHSTAIQDPATAGATQPMRKAVVKIRRSLVCPMK